MKLQKLVYCAYGWWLAYAGLAGKRLTADHPEIWRHGPVFPELYHALKIFGRSAIMEPQARNPFLEPDLVEPGDTDTQKLVGWIWNRYGHLTSFALSDLTHKPGTPWYRVAQENDFLVELDTQIPDQYIFEEFSSIFERESGRANKRAAHAAQAAQSGG
ncbi:Panacea domain-containing protein [Wenzhouxiangella marina]|nr:type II toxin-antitoxin system antitoxin SocA domain-containing protein [Wenzhouxiangella marina]